MLEFTSTFESLANIAKIENRISELTSELSKFENLKEPTLKDVDTVIRLLQSFTSLLQSARDKLS